MSDNRHWTQTEALLFLADLETKAAAAGLHVALAGSVLYRGESKKDLDVVIYPHTKEKPSSWPLKAIAFVDVQIGKSDLCDFPYRDGKHVRYAFIKSGPLAGRRVDIFLLS